MVIMNLYNQFLKAQCVRYELCQQQ